MKIKLKIALAAILVGTAFIIPASAYAGTQNTTVTDQRVRSELNKNPIVKDLNKIVNFLSAGVGIVVVAVIIMGGIQYSIAGDNPQAVTAAKQRIMNGLLALATFLLLFAFLQWLIPGGIFSPK